MKMTNWIMVGWPEVRLQNRFTITVILCDGKHLNLITYALTDMLHLYILCDTGNVSIKQDRKSIILGKIKQILRKMCIGNTGSKKKTTALCTVHVMLANI